MLDLNNVVDLFGVLRSIILFFPCLEVLLPPPHLLLAGCVLVLYSVPVPLPQPSSPRSSPRLSPWNSYDIHAAEFPLLASRSPVSYLSPAWGAAWSWLSFARWNMRRLDHALPVSCGAAWGRVERNRRGSLRSHYSWSILKNLFIESNLIHQYPLHKTVYIMGPQVPMYTEARRTTLQFHPSLDPVLQLMLVAYCKPRQFSLLRIFHVVGTWVDSSH